MSRDHPRWWYQRSSEISEEKFGISDEMFGISDDMSGISEEMFGSLRFLTRGMSTEQSVGVCELAYS